MLRQVLTSLGGWLVAGGLALGQLPDTFWEWDRPVGTLPAPAESSTDGTPADASDPGSGSSGSLPISGNPGAINIVTGTGKLGEFLGFDEKSGIRLGGLWIGDSNWLATGGLAPGQWALNSLTLVDLTLDAEKLVGFQGGLFGIEFLQYTGQPTNPLTGVVAGFNSLDGPPPLTRQEIYQLWWRQTFFDDKLIVRVGKSVPTYDFNNVLRPVRSRRRRCGATN
jgi:porin